MWSLRATSFVRKLTRSPRLLGILFLVIASLIGTESSALGGGRTLDDIVTMTVFITDSRYGDEFVELRKKYFTQGYPCSALIGAGHSRSAPPE